MPCLVGSHPLRTSNKKLCDKLAQDTAPTAESANTHAPATNFDSMWYCAVRKKHYSVTVKGAASQQQGAR